LFPKRENNTTIQQQMPKKGNPSPPPKGILGIYNFASQHLTALSSSKYFAGFMIVLLNISSKFVTFKFSKAMEAYLKYTFSRNVLIFAMSYMGCRDIVIAFTITISFIICMDYLLNEESALYILPESFKTFHLNKFEENMDNKTTEPTPDEVNRAIQVLSKIRYSGNSKNTSGGITTGQNLYS
jgi:hypothetical protein